MAGLANLDEFLLPQLLLLLLLPLLPVSNMFSLARRSKMAVLDSGRELRLMASFALFSDGKEDSDSNDDDVKGE